MTFLAALPGCKEEAPAPKAGERLFHFDYRRAASFEILRNDPESGTWNARLEKTGTQWKITAAANGEDHPDRFGNSGFIDHLLDAISTLRVTGSPEPGPAQAFGLARPQWVLRWTVEGGRHELGIGDPAREGLGRFVVKGPGDFPVVTADGAAFGLAAKISDFDSIRHPWVSVWPIDDVFDVEIKGNRGAEFYAERRAGGWVDRAGKPRPGLDEWLNRLLHVRIQRYIRAPRASKLFDELNASPKNRVYFHDRLGKQRWIQASMVGSEVIAISGERPSAAFAISPDDLSLFSFRSQGH